LLYLSILIVILACLIAPFLGPTFGRNAGWILAIPLLVATMVVAAAGASTATTVTEVVPWMPTIGVDLALRLDGLSLLFAMLVLGIGALILAYSARYLGRGNHTTFFLLMTAFAAAMLTLVLADDLVVLFVAWEATTLCSFFLIARSGPDAREPAIRTLLVTATGGLSLLSAIAVIAVETGTTRLSAVLVDPAWQENAGFATVVAILLAIAALTKSAQFPFQAWLPDSMVAITPVSAYLHAATMVKAGIYLLLRFSPALADVSIWNVLLVSSGLTTALLGGFGALRQYDLKGLLAYSTMSQLGLIVALIGIGTPSALAAAVVFTFGHALFKAALFMLIGVIDHEAGTRDTRKLSQLRLQAPVTKVALVLAAASMAGIPPLLGFVSKESMFDAFLDAPGPAWVALTVTFLSVAVSVLTFAYSGRIILGGFGGRRGPVIAEAPASFWFAPAVCAAAGAVFGLVPFTLDRLISDAASTAVGRETGVYLALWHGVNAPLGMSIAVILLGTTLVVGRSSVDRVIQPIEMPISGLAVVDSLRAATIGFGGEIARLAGSTDPRRHLVIPVGCVILIAAIGGIAVGDIPPLTNDPSRTRDWVLVGLVAVGVIAAVRARTRISAIVVTGVVGFAMTLWFVDLGAADVALTQLLVEILTVAVMVLVLQRLPAEFSIETGRKALPVVLAAAAGSATTLGVWALTGRRDPSPAAEYFLRQGEQETGGANIVNTILVDFRALDTLGEMAVLGIAGVAIAALLSTRHLLSVTRPDLIPLPLLTDSRENSVFVRTVALAIVPILIVLSIVLLLRGHQEPGGGFIAALLSGAGFVLVYLAAPSDEEARIRWPYLALIGTGVVVGVATGLLGFVHGSFLTPMYIDVPGGKLASALVFDLGIYLAVIGILLAAFNLLGHQRRTIRQGHHLEPESARLHSRQEVGGP
jgi:multicomponent Na+:H+ antiporter subunit A